jgi:hypothetical protein
MDGRIARKLAGSRWILTLAVGLGILALVIGLWRLQVESHSRQRAQAAEREARLAALCVEEEARRMEAERQAAKVKTIERVGQLYHEINNLTQLGDRVQTSLRDHPRMLKSSEPESQSTP